jgi:hypothetical protein
MSSHSFDAIARQVLRALRGHRSQAALSKRLGFRSNVAAKWESGQRMPTAQEALAYGTRLKLDPLPALESLNRNAAAALGDGAVPDLGAWLRALKGTQLLGTIADRSGLSRYSVGRMLAGQSEPRLPQFLALLDAITDRVEDFVDGWVGVEHVPLLEPRLRRTRAARAALFQRPLCLAVMCLLDTVGLRCERTAQLSLLCQLLERSPVEIEACLDILVEGGVIRLAEDRYVTAGALTVDAHSSPDQERAARHFWTGVGHERTARLRPDDLCSYNVFSVARKDYARLKELQREFYRGARALIAASEPTEVAGLLVVQLGCWDPMA